MELVCVCPFIKFFISTKNEHLSLLDINESNNQHFSFFTKQLAFKLIFRHAWNILQERLRRINDDILLKENSLMLDNRVMATRKRLQNVMAPETETDKNLVVTGITRDGLKNVLGLQYA
jgi:hypothetical protein